MNMYGNKENGNTWVCVKCLRDDICETEMCECWEQPDTVECLVCGNIWDGNAQCTCLMLGEVSDYETSDEDDEMVESPTNKDDDVMSVSSEASDSFNDFEETGSISLEFTRNTIRQMLTIARSQAESVCVPAWMDEACDEVLAGNFTPDGHFVPPKTESVCVPAWMDEACDEVLAGNFTPDGHFVPPKTEKSKKQILEDYPMLTEPELTELHKQLANEPIEDIIDTLNMRRMREYETARVYHIHWPAWAVGEQPEMQFIKRV